jgi:hypothetical protein
MYVRVVKLESACCAVAAGLREMFAHEEEKL